MAASSPDNMRDKVEDREPKRRNQHPKLAELRGSAMTRSSSEEDTLVTEATQVLLEFAVTKGHTLHSVTNMSPTQLADFLREFYGKVRLKNSESLTLKDIRTGLHKFFLDESRADILRDHKFDFANASFDLTAQSATNNNNTSRKSHRMRIESEDLKKMYLSEAMDTNRPDSLQNKVFFDISLYICNKGKEHFRNMKKTDFTVSTDVHGRRYVWLRESSSPTDKQLAQSHKRNAEEELPSQVGERMYERAGDPRCPLTSFLKYMNHLHPMTEAFWQRPKRNVSQSDYVWYEHAALGSSTLTRIMQRISLQAGLSENYTNFSIRSACIPLLEDVCEKALLAEGGAQTAHAAAVNTDTSKTTGAVLSHSASTEMSSDDAMSHTSDMQTSQSDVDGRETLTVRERRPKVSESVGSGSFDADDGDLYGLMPAKTQVLDLIRGLLVKDIQKFVDWLKTVRVQYSNGELIVLCSPVEKSSVEPIMEDVKLDRNGLTSSFDNNSQSLHSNNHCNHHPFRKTGSLDRYEKLVHSKHDFLLKTKFYEERQELPESTKATIKQVQDLQESTKTTIKQVEFSSLSGMHCSSQEFSQMKISIPTPDTLLITGVPEDVQVLLHQKDQVHVQHPLPQRVFCSQSEMDIAELVATLNARSHRTSRHVVASGGSSEVVGGRHVVTGGGSSEVGGLSHNLNSSPDYQHKHLLTVQQPYNSPVMLTIPAAHSSSQSARERFKDQRIRSLGCLDQPPAIPEGVALKRVSSTGTPVLKRQPNVDNSFPENLTFKRDNELSTKRLLESPEAKKARAEQLTESLRLHQEILQNSPLIKRPGERNFSGFRHCYANTAASSMCSPVMNSVKPEPLDTSSYS